MTALAKGVIIGVTGAIGEAVANGFLTKGSQVLGVARNGFPDGTGLTQNPGFLFKCADATIESETLRVFSEAIRIYGTLDYVVYTPGLKPRMDIPLAECSIHEWRSNLDTYASGFLICFKAALKFLAPGGHIIAIGSAVTRFKTGSLPPFFVGQYSAAKAALNELCKWGRREAHEKGLLLSRIAPSAVDVPFHRDAPESRKPVAMVPLSYLVDRILSIAMDHEESDEEVIATPDGVKVERTPT